MVDMKAIMNVITTILAFVEGVVDQVAPIVNKVLDRKPPPPPQPTINPNCQPPHCGISPYYCPDEQLSSICLQRKMAVDNSFPRRLTTLSFNTDDNNNESTEKSSTSMSPSSTIMLVFISVIALAIIGFLWIRCRHQNDETWNYDDRKSSTWTV
ncbi:unnamed protein product [Rotaria sp. Silwood2]|nr:unnamed protein product [Rotaria sp. Silwood2]CAF4063872.1 unnamed protein product [Rotaria sp. Silwood2]CAF4104924.1 unnamed protein product [Rotaria sp. Silwood2]CAF4346320.1 unnamed protein product [Rotaria sp. Silwood2]CAF4493247.1 unnamed protein product [Rotaria sp. Silwood2]